MQTYNENQDRIERGINQIRQEIPATNPVQPVFNNVNDDYLLVAAHVDLNTQVKIARGEFVELAKLLPKDRNASLDNRMELISKNGRSYFVPVTDKELTHISSFGCWEQAFRVHANIYLKYHPHRAHELIEYTFMIHLASMPFTWENVYQYDKDFRMYMEKHSQRSWTLILQQAWSFRLRDRHPG